jgi:hypothetical protein
VQQAEKVSTDSDQVAKAAMMTAEGAMNFMRSTISGDLGSFPSKHFLVWCDQNSSTMFLCTS